MLKRSTQFYLILLISLIYNSIFGQVTKDMANSVPIWFETDEESGITSLNWLEDPNATSYTIYEVYFGPIVSTSLVGEAEANQTSFIIDPIPEAVTKNYYVLKGTNSGATGVGLIHCGTKIEPVINRGRCFLAVTDTIILALPDEVGRLQHDLEVDGWMVDLFIIPDTADVPYVKNELTNWYDEEYELSQTMFILGHVPVPYSGNTAYDGHNNHYGAWSADTYYAEINGNWTDQFVNETSPSRVENDNIPGDGKFDQSSIPGNVEIEIGRVDFSNLPAFPEGEIELTRRYLEKNHHFKMGNRQLPRRALVENNFAGFDEAFGQSAWRNFPTFFKGENVMVGNYDGQLDTSAYLCSYACGGGSYTSCGGVGTTVNLWVAKDIQTVFTMVFGSYFGDWDSQNNFLRSALASGDILTNAWSGRPIWQLFHMGLGKHIGYSAKFTMNANSSVFESGYGAHSAHIALLGDPTLRLFYPKPIDTLSGTFVEGDVLLEWPEDEDNSPAYTIYRSKDSGDWEVLEELWEQNSYADPCVYPGNYSYMIKTIRLEETGSGSFYNTSLGVSTNLNVESNEWLIPFYLDVDNDGFGNPEIETLACTLPEGYAANDLDCDDNNPNINPDAIDIPDNNVDENCDGVDAVNTFDAFAENGFRIYPNPSNGIVHIETMLEGKFTFKICDYLGKTLISGKITDQIQIDQYNPGIYWLEIRNSEENKVSVTKLILQ